MQETAKKLVKAYYSNELAVDIEIEEIYVVWFCKTLKNWKAFLSTPIADTRYFEVTYNGEKDETYLDCYTKEKNLRLTEKPQ